MYIYNLKYYLQKAREYNQKNESNYPCVYFSANKSGRWGVTFPAPNDEIGHTSTDMTGRCDNRDFATAVAMFVEDIAKDPVSYLEWGKKNNLFLRTQIKNYTNALYVRYEYNYGHKYKVCVPTDQYGYEVVRACESSVYFMDINRAIAARNRVLERKLHNENLSEKRKNAFTRALISGAWQEFSMFKNNSSWSIRKNIDNFSTILAMFVTYCQEDDMVEAAITIYDWLDTLGNETENIEKVIESLNKIKDYVTTIKHHAEDSKQYIDYLIEIAISIKKPVNVVDLDIDGLREKWGCKHA